MNTLQAFFAKYSATTHTLAAVFASLVVAYAEVPAFHAFVANAYAHVPAGAQSAVLAAFGLYTWYRNGEQPAVK